MMALQGEVELSLMTVVNHLTKQPECLQPDKFQRMNIWPLLEWAEQLDEERDYRRDWEDEIGASRCGERLTVSESGALRGARLDYHFRPRALDEMSYFDWIQFADKLQRSAKEPVNKDDDFIRFEFPEDHPEWHTCCIRLREWKDRVIPLYLGPALPDRMHFVCEPG
jgi:hypothetical protein